MPRPAFLLLLLRQPGPHTELNHSSRTLHRLCRPVHSTACAAPQAGCARQAARTASPLPHTRRQPPAHSPAHATRLLPLQAERARQAARPYVEGAQEVAADTAGAAKGTAEVGGGLGGWVVVGARGTASASGASCGRVLNQALASQKRQGMEQPQERPGLDSSCPQRRPVHRQTAVGWRRCASCSAARAGPGWPAPLCCVWAGAVGTWPAAVAGSPRSAAPSSPACQQHQVALLCACARPCVPCVWGTVGSRLKGCLPVAAAGRARHGPPPARRGAGPAACWPSRRPLAGPCRLLALHRPTLRRAECSAGMCVCVCSSRACPAPAAPQRAAVHLGACVPAPPGASTLP